MFRYNDGGNYQELHHNGIIVTVVITGPLLTRGRRVTRDTDPGHHLVTRSLVMIMS